MYKARQGFACSQSPQRTFKGSMAPSVYLFFLKFIYLKGRERNGETEVFYLLVLSQNALWAAGTGTRALI